MIKSQLSLASIQGDQEDIPINLRKSLYKNKMNKALKVINDECGLYPVMIQFSPIKPSGVEDYRWLGDYILARCDS